MKPILEPIPLGEQQTIMAFQHCQKDFVTPWHFHPQHELTYIEASVGTKFIGDYVGPYEPGELVLLRSNVPHCWRNHQQQVSDAKSLVVQWNRGVFAKAPELSPVFEMLKMASKGIIFDKKSVLPLVPQLKEITKLKGQELYLQLLTVLIKLSASPCNTLSASSFVEDLPTEYGSRMAKIHDFVGAEFHRKIYLKELADLVNMSEQSFSRFFTKMMGRSFFTFLNEYRVNAAARLLLDTESSVSQIGFECGYESPPFFFKKFNETYQVSPAKYRKYYKSQVKPNIDHTTNYYE